VAACLLLASVSAPLPSPAAPSERGQAIPQVDDAGQQAFAAYRMAGKHKAFAIAPGGVWTWQADAASRQQAEREALSTCESRTRQKCVLYAMDDAVVFDRERWPTLWGPYASERNAAQAATGARVGERFYDLAFRDRDGSSSSLSQARGRIVLLHFWGSWCRSCLHELPALRALRAALAAATAEDVELILLQVREPFAQTHDWAEQHGFADLPLYDSGSGGSEDTDLMLADGRALDDRHVARVFPSSYVLDRRGMVVFSHAGPVDDWLEYLPFFEHAASHNGTTSTDTSTGR